MDSFEEANFETTINQTLRDMKGELRQLVDCIQRQELTLYQTELL